MMRLRLRTDSDGTTSECRILAIRTGLLETDYGRVDMTALRFRRRELIDDIEDDRYFVVLLAYDFQQLWKQKKRVLLWDALQHPAATQ